MQQLREKSALHDVSWLIAAAKSQKGWPEHFSQNFLGVLYNRPLEMSQMAIPYVPCHKLAKDIDKLRMLELLRESPLTVFNSLKHVLSEKLFYDVEEVETCLNHDLPKSCDLLSIIYRHPLQKKLHFLLVDDFFQAVGQTNNNDKLKMGFCRNGN